MTVESWTLQSRIVLAKMEFSNCFHLAKGWLDRAGLKVKVMDVLLPRQQIIRFDVAKKLS